MNLNCNEDLTGEILPANDFECSAVALYLLDVRESNGEMRARFGVDSRLISPAEERGASPTATTINLNLERGGEGIRGEGGGRMRGEEEGGMQPSTRRGDKRHGGGNIVSTSSCSNSNQLHEGGRREERESSYSDV